MFSPGLLEFIEYSKSKRSKNRIKMSILLTYLYHRAYYKHLEGVVLVVFEGLTKSMFPGRVRNTFQVKQCETMHKGRGVIYTNSYSGASEMYLSFMNVSELESPFISHVNEALDSDIMQVDAWSKFIYDPCKQRTNCNPDRGFLFRMKLRICGFNNVRVFQMCTVYSPKIRMTNWKVCNFLCQHQLIFTVHGTSLLGTSNGPLSAQVANRTHYLCEYGPIMREIVFLSMSPGQRGLRHGYLQC